jgi:hypothetical protein
MKENETSVTFHIDKELLKKFDKATELKSSEVGILLNRKQSLHLALKEAISAWTKEKPESI